MKPMHERSVILAGLLTAFSVGLVGCLGEDASDLATSTVTGTVTDELGVPIEGATVTSFLSSSSALTLSPDSTITDTTTTDDDGTYEIEVAEEDGAVTVDGEAFTPYRGRFGGGRGPHGRHPRDGRVHLELADGRGPAARMDTDGDGLISAEEWKGPEEIFLDIDADGDGFLTQEELQAARAKRREERPHRGPLDEDGDGLISETEWMGPPEIFEELDSDDDGSLTEAELRAGWEARHAHGPPPAP